MFKFNKMDDEVKQKLNIDSNIESYCLKRNNKYLGYGFFNHKEENQIQILILKEYQGNGYGKLLFGYMLEIARQNGLKEIFLTFDKSNYKTKNIIESFGGLEISLNNNEITYVLGL